VFKLIDVSIKRQNTMSHTFQGTGQVASPWSPTVRFAGTLGRVISGARSAASVVWTRVRGEVTVSPVSEAWLAAHAVDASKRSHDG
jgi:hypothetical protein